MYTLNLKSDDRKIQVDEDQTVWEALIGAGIFLRTDCGGKGFCGKCRVKVASDSTENVAAANESEIKILGRSDRSHGMRLACRLKLTGDVALEIPATSRLSAEVARKGLPMLVDWMADQKRRQVGGPASYGLAVDLGTTTVAVYLCDLANGRVMASTSARNPQTLFGDDVMSRIGAIRMDPALLIRQQKMAVKAIEWGITSILLHAYYLH